MGKESIRSAEPSETTAIELAIRSLQDVPQLVRMHEADPFLNKGRQALFGQRNRAGANGLTKEVVNRYLIDNQSLLWLEMERSATLVRRTSVLAIPSWLVSDLLALIHCQHGHLGVARRLALSRDRFNWPGMCRDAREYVLSCGCRRRKRSGSEKLAMLRARFMELWEVREVDLQKFPKTSEADNEYVLLVVDNASKFPFAYPLPSEDAHRVTRPVLDLSLTFGVPSFIRADGGRGL